jgi:hypothetical protein
MSHIDSIVSTAKAYKGQEEIQPNLGFKDPSFNSKMNAVGFYRTASWCGFFVMMVIFGVYTDVPVILAYLKKYLSPSTHTMWANMRASKEIITGQTPKLGAIAIWEEGDGTNGHTGIVIDVNPDGKHFTTSEGNSNSDGSRNGYEVAENTHTLGLPHSVNGLNLLGFGYMPE